MDKNRCKKCGQVITEKKLTRWCGDCLHHGEDPDYCMQCVDRSLAGITVPKPSGYVPIGHTEGG